MGIIFDEASGCFHLKTRNSSYLIHIFHGHYPAHLYYGKRLETDNLTYLLRFEERAHIMNDDPDDRAFSPETLPQEYPSFGGGDLRMPAYQIRDTNGQYISDVQYRSSRIYHGKEKNKGLPGLFVCEGDQADTLELFLEDPVLQLEIVLKYTVLEEYDVITRSVRLKNKGTKALHLLKALSMNVDFPNGTFDMIHLTGSWARECSVERTPLFTGRIELDSVRGVSSSQHNPFFLLADREAGEEFGDVYGFGLIYSGNHLIQAEADQYGQVRVGMGIHPRNFDWLLEAQEEFHTPECVMAYSDQGIGAVSRIFHRVYRERLCKSKYAGKPRPILVNSWEAFYFDFNEEKIVEMAEEAARLGIDLLVLDDGWFGKRNDARSSLGDWKPNLEKLPGGIEGLADRVQAAGVKFGLWIEPEMISPDSLLFQKHPDYRLHVRGREGHQSRNQFVLDLSREDVCCWLIETVSGLLKNSNISYIKWDMNRQISEAGSALLPPERQGEIYHRYVLGLYRCLEELTERFPDVLFEGCEGGGGRFDPGILHYMPQIWASDDTDAAERVRIQYGYSFAYPWSCISAHYSAVPNHQTGRIIPEKTRALTAMTGSFGYELNLLNLSNEEKEVIRQTNFQYRKDSELLNSGEFYRLCDPSKGERVAWMLTDKEGTKAFVYCFSLLRHPNQPFGWLKLKGLIPDKTYLVKELEREFTGMELMKIGLPLPMVPNDFSADCYHLEESSKAEGK